MKEIGIKSNKICFCPKSIQWILNHLRKGSTSRFIKMIDGMQIKRKKPRSAKQRANDKRLGRMAKARARRRR